MIIFSYDIFNLLVEDMSKTTQNDKSIESQAEIYIKRNLFQRIFGICATKPPQDANCWKLIDNKIEIDLRQAKELSHSGRGIRLEDIDIPVRILIFKGDDGLYHAFQNQCSHGGRRLDPIQGGNAVQCCSMGKSTFDNKGKRIAGSANENIKTFPVRLEAEKLVITL
jgi:nitrite reductase/ring-hydroxylating ferredoxin subunit